MSKTLIIAGPTASGKTSLAFSLAEKLGGEIINADSVAVYKGFDIGAAKPTVGERKKIPHHLFDLFDASEDCDAGLYAKLAKEKISDIRSRGKLPIVVGGTGLYIRALLGESFHDLPHDPKIRAELVEKSKEELYELLTTNDPDRAKELHPNDHFRLARALEIFFITGKTLKELTSESPKERDQSILFIAIDPDRDQLLERIEKRTRLMLRRGLVHEVRVLLAQGVSPVSKPMQSIGYKQANEFLASDSEDWDDLQEKITIATRQFARKQVTWFKKVSTDLTLKHPDVDQVLTSLIKLGF